MGGDWFSEVFGASLSSHDCKVSTTQVADIGLRSLREQLDIERDPDFIRPLLLKVSLNSISKFCLIK